MRTGADYRQSRRDGRRVWVMGEGQVEDVTTHPATHAMVEEYAAWYDRHLDPAWQDLLLTPPNADRERIPFFPRGDRAGCAGITFTAGCRRRNSPWAWLSL